MSKIVMTMPIKPQKETNIGMYIDPRLMNVLSDILSCDSVMAINLLNTYKDKDSELKTFIDDLDRQGIIYNDLFIDKDHVCEILSLIQELVYDGFVKKSNEEIFRCDCGKVDILKQGINSNISKLYYEKNGIYYCKECGSECKSFREEVLTLELSKDIDDSILIVPTFLKNDVKHLSKTFKGGKLLISKQRDTGYQLMVDNKKFNIDIDFLWTNYFRLFDNEQIIMLASNHQTYQMYLLNYLNKIISGNEICFVANPYMNKSNVMNPLVEYEKTEDSIYKKLFILYNLKWRSKNCDWSPSIIDFLSNISTTRRNNLYRVIESCGKKIDESGLPLDLYLESILQKGINMQRNIPESKKLVKKM